MQLWSERKWWHVATNILMTLACLVLFVALFVVVPMYYKNPDEMPGWLSGLVVLWFFSWLVAGLATLVVLYGHSHVAEKNKLLALVHKPTGRVIEAGLTKVWLKNWPFRTSYYAVSYPTSFAFACPLQPMTRNPKVVPLTATVEMELPPHNGRELWFATYLRDPEATGKEFRRHAFDALQHGLPQELAERMNPYDEPSQTEFLGFVQDTLYRRFEVLREHGSIFPDPVLKARFAAQHPDQY